MLRNEIIRKIEERVMSAKKKDYSIWTIGITDNPEERKEQHKNEGKNIEYWLDWETENEDDARFIEEFFITKGMKGSGGGPTNGNYVYIF